MCLLNLVFGLLFFLVQFLFLETEMGCVEEILIIQTQSNNNYHNVCYDNAEFN